MNRLKSAFDKLPHLDLLAPSRRLWSKCLDNCSLSTVERDVLGVQREGDVPGAEIPGIYFRFLRRKNPAPLKPVFYHNAQDILSLAMLTWRIHRMLEDPFCEASRSMELFGVGRFMEIRDDLDMAIQCYEFLRERHSGTEACRLASVNLAILHKRRQDWNSARLIWEELLLEKCVYYQAYRDYAIYLEHILKDYVIATRVVREALDRLDAENLVSRQGDSLDTIRR